MSDITRLLANDDPNDAEEWAGTAEVTSLTPDPSVTPDGRRLITVSWRGTEIDCAYLASYTPAVGHRVTFIKSGPILFVLGTPATV